jgi:hypothetical protein
VAAATQTEVPNSQPFIETPQAIFCKAYVNNHINSTVVLGDWLGSESRLSLAVISLQCLADHNSQCANSWADLLP